MLRFIHITLLLLVTTTFIFAQEASKSSSKDNLDSKKGNVTVQKGGEQKVGNDFATNLPANATEPNPSEELKSNTKSDDMDRKASPQKK